MGNTQNLEVLFNMLREERKMIHIKWSIKTREDRKEYFWKKKKQVQQIENSYKHHRY